ncbi:valine--tRNA ligase [Candidatus Woesearchaeota archaeon]|nr:valine--tRNA ligase [Candidatus Woesearchaeota archaeon]
MDEHYRSKEAEPKWQQFWEENEIYVFHPDAKRETFSIDTPPPTVSGKMHLGHAFSYTQQDIIARYQRMKGKNVFFPFGTDDNGLPTEKLVEQKKNVLSRTLSREEFVRLCLQVIEEEKPKFIHSWKEIGMSADFKGSYSTINQHSQITSQASFIELYQKGRIYQQESPSTFCVACQTAIAQAEFENIEMKSHFNDIAFKAQGKDVIISTTRPELIPACVALFYHPDDVRYTAWKGKFARVPLFDYDVPFLADASVDPEKGTGLMMVCTFGDKEDVDKWHRFHLPLRVVIEKYGRMNELAGEFKGLKLKEARQKILEKLKEQGYLLRQQEISHPVNVHERCKTEIEFLKTKQWYIRILDRKEELLEAGNQIAWYPPHMKVRYDHWVQNLNWDWCISRQRHFGIPLPAWRCKKCNTIILPDTKDLPVDPAIHAPKKPCRCGSTQFISETDVLDTWATSSLTPEIAGNWVHHGEYGYVFDNKPFALRPQAHDIIRTWLFYTMVQSSYHHGRVPWKNVMISGHAQDPQGRKMSKSLGNIIEPQAMIQKYSADALRFWAAGSKLGDDLPFLEKDLVTGQKCVTKLWNASKLSLLHLQDYMPENILDNNGQDGRKRATLELFDRWLLSRLHRVIQESTESFDHYEYSQTKLGVENFFWHVFCDYYLEIAKDRLYNPNRRGVEARKSAQYALYEALLSIVKMMAPIMPHITEEIYQQYFAQKEKQSSLHLSSWPKFDPRFIDADAEAAGDLGMDIIAAVRKHKSEEKVSIKEEIAELVVESQEPGFADVIYALQDDLKATLSCQVLKLTGKTSFESEKFGVKIGATFAKGF